MALLFGVYSEVEETMAAVQEEKPVHITVTRNTWQLCVGGKDCSHQSDQEHHDRCVQEGKPVHITVTRSTKAGVCRRESLSSLRWPGTKKGRKERRCPSDPSLSFPRLCFQKGLPPPMVPQAGHLQGGVVFQIQTINMLKEPRNTKN